MSASHHNPHYRRAVLMVILGGVCLSMLGIGDRLMQVASGPQVVFYRALSQSLFFGAVFGMTRKRAAMGGAFKGLGAAGWAAAAAMSLAGALLVMSFQFTLVANAVFFISLAPLFAAALAWVFLKETVTRQTGFAMLIAFIGVAIIFGSNMSFEGSIGMGLAAAMALSYAGAVVLMRTNPKADVLLICTLSAIMTMGLMAPFIESFALPRQDLLICLGLGIFQVGLGTFLIMSAARYVPAAQVTILALVEVVLSPIWVWVFAKEIPSFETLLGGAIVFTGVIYQALDKQSASNIAVK